jgi:hypothetical protein
VYVNFGDLPVGAFVYQPLSGVEPSGIRERGVPYGGREAAAPPDLPAVTLPSQMRCGFVQHRLLHAEAAQNHIGVELFGPF